MRHKTTTDGHSADISPSDHTDYEALAIWAETAEISTQARILKASGKEAGMALLEAAIGSSAEVRRAVGKPSLSEKGPSPSRSVRLSAEMDALLLDFAKRSQMKPSEIIRRALGEYLDKAS